MNRFIEIRPDLDGNAMTKADGDVNSEVQVHYPKTARFIGDACSPRKSGSAPEPEAGDVKLSGTITAEGDLPGERCSSSRRHLQVGCRLPSKDEVTFPEFTSTGRQMTRRLTGESMARLFLDEDGNAISKSDNDVNAEMQGLLSGVDWCTGDVEEVGTGESY